MPGLHADTVRHALQVARKKGFAEVEIELDGSTFSATLEKGKTKPKPAGSEALEAAADEPLEIKSTLVGYYGVSKPPLEVGRTISIGDVVAVVSALGLANEIESEHGGEIVEVLVSDGDPVEYGQPLARVKVGT
jgi:acetyl-CoA carboxylase biotin carboxyl carrier protein